MLKFSFLYDHVLALCIVNLVDAKDHTVGDQLFSRAMYSVLMTLGLRAPLQDGPAERYAKGLHVIRTIFDRASAHDLVRALKHLRAFYRELPTQKRTTLYDEYFSTIATLLLDRLTSNALPRYALKPFLKTAVLLREYLGHVNAEGLRVLLELVQQRANVEITYWASRLLWALALRHLVQESEVQVCVEAVLEVLIRVDISLSYRSLLCDLCIMENETPCEGVSLVRGITAYGRLSLLRDNNPSIQAAILRLLNQPAGVEGDSNTRLVNGFHTTLEEERKRIVKSDEGKKSFCSMCTRLFSEFVLGNMPSQIEAERKEVGMRRMTNP